MHGRTACEEEFGLVARMEKTLRTEAKEMSAGNALVATLEGNPGWSSDAGMGDAAQQYQHFAGWVYASIRPIAQLAAGQPVRLARLRARRAVEGGAQRKRGLFGEEARPWWSKAWGGELEPVQVHPLLDAIAQPNEMMVGWSLTYVTLVSLELTGRAFWWLNSTGEGTSIWPVPVHWVSAKQGGGWQIRSGGGSAVDVPAEDLAYFSYPSPSDPLGAVSPLQTQARAVRADESIQAAQDHAFRNGIRPGFAIVAGDAIAGDGGSRRPVLTKEQRVQLATSIKQMYRGVTRWDEPLILDGMIKDIHKVTHTPAEMDFLNSGRMTKQRITQGFGVNPVIMGEIEGANRASALAAREHFCEFTVNPKLELVSQVMNRWVGPRFARNGERLVVWIEPCRAKDPEEQRKEEEHLLAAGALSVNELRGRHGLPKIENGDVVWMGRGKMAERCVGEGSGEW